MIDGAREIESCVTRGYECVIQNIHYSITWNHRSARVIFSARSMETANVCPEMSIPVSPSKQMAIIWFRKGCRLATQMARWCNRHTWRDPQHGAWGPTFRWHLCWRWNGLSSCGMWLASRRRYCWSPTGWKYVLCLGAVATIVGWLDDTENREDLLGAGFRVDGGDVGSVVPVLVSCGWQESLLECDDLLGASGDDTADDELSIWDEEVAESCCDGWVLSWEVESGVVSFCAGLGETDRDTVWGCNLLSKISLEASINTGLLRVSGQVQRLSHGQEAHSGEDWGELHFCF